MIVPPTPTPSSAPSVAPSPVQTVGPIVRKAIPSIRCDVVIVGGSTAAIAAGIAAAKAEPGLHVVLLEPTDWIGGQLTSSAVCAVDWPSVQGCDPFQTAKANWPRIFNDIV